MYLDILIHKHMDSVDLLIPEMMLQIYSQQPGNRWCPQL